MHEVRWMNEAIQLAYRNVESGNGGPFGAIVVKDGKVIGTGVNEVTSHNDPTAHAEVQAIREACRLLGSFQLTDCDIYTSCEPCPMCLGAIYWARPRAVYFSFDRGEAASIGFDDAFIYDEIGAPLEQRRIPMHRLQGDTAEDPFVLWRTSHGRVEY
ncbi:nucleoside deaminase [Paenibacillus koleovorans]|uniref:nucleoside deaminase n=1 Tax=Paenibacillus koleovorans TaxID=121608 RepID=UPI000FDC2442|nr:nucleoside deaminase [Paenibacillus koleovorans]